MTETMVEKFERVKALYKKESEMWLGALATAIRAWIQCALLELVTVKVLEFSRTETIPCMTMNGLDNPVWSMAL